MQQAITPTSYRGQTATKIRIGDTVIVQRHVPTAHFEVIYLDAQDAGIGSEQCALTADQYNNGGVTDANLVASALENFNLTTE